MEQTVDCVIETKKGNRCVVIENYKLSEHRTLRNGSGIIFRCTNRQCKVKVLVDADVKMIVQQMNMPHNHQALSKRTVSRERIKCALIRIVAASTGARTFELVQAEIERHSDLAESLLPADIHLLRKCVYSARIKRYDKMLYETFR